MHENFCKKYSGGSVRVEFSLNRYPIRNQHAAVRKFGKFIKIETLFPNETNFVPIDKRRFRWGKPFETALKMISGLNISQEAAVKNVLLGGGLCHPMVIFGPAGTGKTRTLVELTKIILNCSSANILIAAPSNAAADIITNRLGAAGYDPNKICRWNALRRIDKQIDPKIVNFSNDDKVKYVRNGFFNFYFGK